MDKIEKIAHEIIVESGFFDRQDKTPEEMMIRNMVKFIKNKAREVGIAPKKLAQEVYTRIK